MNKQDTIDYLNSTTVDDMPYLFIPSYTRPAFVSARTILQKLDDNAIKKSYMLVREEEKDFYYEQNKELIERGCNMLVIPKGEVTGVGSTRNYILDYAKEHGMDVVMDFDDDLTHLGALYEGLNRNGVLSSRPFLKEESDEMGWYTQKVLQAAGKCARSIFAEHPEVLLMGLRKQRFSNNLDNAATKYYINKGTTPRASKIINMAAVNEKDLRVPELFDKHGDDIGFVANLLQEGYSCGIMPWLYYAYTPEKEGSVLRDADEEKNRDIHATEFNNLQKFEIKDYLRFDKAYDDGSYMYGSVNFQKYNKLKGTKWIVRRFEDEK